MTMYQNPNEASISYYEILKNRMEEDEMKIDKIQKEYPDFCNEAGTLTEEQLKARIVSLQEALEESEEHKAIIEEARKALENE